MNNVNRVSYNAETGEVKANLPEFGLSFRETWPRDLSAEDLELLIDMAISRRIEEDVEQWEQYASEYSHRRHDC